MNKKIQKDVDIYDRIIYHSVNKHENYLIRILFMTFRHTKRDRRDGEERGFFA